MINYTVVPGDTLWGIAMKHGIGISELLEINPQIKNPTLIFPGQKIAIPSTSTDTYVVIKGDTLWNIANKYNINLNNLIKANLQIKNPSLIIPGQIISIPNGESTPDIPNVPNDMKSLGTEVIKLVNDERRKNGLQALTENNEVSRVAEIKSNDFIQKNYFSHDSPTYGTPFDMLRTFDIPFTAAAENIASGQNTAAQVMNSWMNSTGHRANILSSTYNQIGVGVARDKSGKLFWTQIFIKS